jgi:RNA recognition motif-containing protein
LRGSFLPTFKGLDGLEESILKKLFVGNLDASTNEDDLKALFADFGTVRSSSLATDIFSGKCRGFGFVEMEGHEARAAIAALDGKDFRGKSMKVKYEVARPGGRRR